ncbi:ABC transporter substrate-binding protein [Streptomyces sp. NPDC056600]|uniref:ABC transporter substrate-binding protein n=1 Tax=Streptomyces sp. NPDC056600 TaxID=3345874 RepID=UPI0036B33B77
MRSQMREARRPWTAALAAAAALLLGSLSGCGGETGPRRPDRRITVWSQESLPDRIAATEKVVDRFRRESGIEVELVGVAEAQMPQLVMSAAASGTLPDVIGAATLGQIWQMYGNELLNTRIPGRVVATLGPGTFDANALALASDGATRLAVPSDAWLQLLVYRKDRFDRRRLSPPDTYGRMLDAARRLTGDGRDGVSAATDPADVFTSQSFESLALANDCRLVEAGRVSLASPRCERAFAVYDRLARDYGAPGTQTVDSTRATYFAGRSSMVIWSSFVLDEMAGLRADALPSCPECAKDPRFLSRNSGIITSLRGPDATEPAQFGEVTSWAVTRTAEEDASRRFVEYMMGAGYEGWFGMAPEGKIPVRRGTAEEPDRYLRAWRSSELGVDRRRPIDEVYPPELLDRLVEGVRRIRRWGIAQGEGALVGAAGGELPVSKAIGAMTAGQLSPAGAAAQADEEVAFLRASLERAAAPRRSP